MTSVYYRGRVILAWYSWIDDKGIQHTKPRPCIIKEVLHDGKYLIIKITKSNKADRVIKILRDSPEGREMGLLEDSHVYIDERRIVSLKEIIRPIGKCPIHIFVQL